MKKIGILGGMGPQTSLHFYEMLIKNTEQKHKTHVRNQDFPHILLASIPVPDLIQGQDGKDITVSMVQNEALSLEKAGADFLVMPCNTMHLFQDEITDGLGIPFLSMIDCVVEKVREQGYSKVGVLGSTTTMTSGLYSEKLLEHGVIPLLPESKNFENISSIIQKYIAGNFSPNDKKTLENYCDTLIANGAQAIILGCTELPLILKESSSKYNFIASSEILAEKTFLYSQNY